MWLHFKQPAALMIKIGSTVWPQVILLSNCVASTSHHLLSGFNSCMVSSGDEGLQWEMPKVREIIGDRARL